MYKIGVIKQATNGPRWQPQMQPNGQLEWVQDLETAKQMASDIVANSDDVLEVEIIKDDIVVFRCKRDVK